MMADDQKLPKIKVIKKNKFKKIVEVDPEKIKDHPK